jgi:hypothetical protein
MSNSAKDGVASSSLIYPNPGNSKTSSTVEFLGPEKSRNRNSPFKDTRTIGAAIE